MERLAGAVLVATLAMAVPAAIAAPASTSAPSLPRVLTCAGKAVVKPASYGLACADANSYFVRIHWTSWSRTSARASATYVQNTCTPTCAEGHFVSYPGKLTLFAPKLTKYGLLFSAIRYSYTVSTSSTLPLEPLSAVSPEASQSRCSADPTAAARYVIPPPPFAVRDVVVRLAAMPPSEPADNGSSYKRLYTVTFTVVHGNAVLPAGHTYTQFAYVSRRSTSAPWCYLKGGSGP